MYPVIRLSETIHLPTYLLLLSLVYCAGIFWVMARARSKDFPLATALDFSLAIMLGGFLGARLFHVAWEAPQHYLSNPIDVFRIWQGGFVFYGGLIGAFLATWALSSFKKISFLDWADFFAPVLSLGYAVGRLACFLNGCCYGSVCEVPWGVSFISHQQWGLEVIPRHPTQIYATLFELVIFALVIVLEKRRQQLSKTWLSFSGTIFFVWLVGHSLGRLLMESLRDDFRGLAPLQVSVSTWLSLTFIGIGAFMLARSYFKKKSQLNQHR